MSQARTNRRVAKQRRQDNNHLSGLGIPHFSKVRSATAKLKRRQHDAAKAAKRGASFGYQKKK